MREEELGDLLRRFDEGRASDGDRASLGGCNIVTLGKVVELLASV